MEKVKLEEFTQTDFLESDIDKAILAIGSCESHGGHLPYGTDTYIAYDIAIEVATRLDNTIVVPPLWFGMSQHYRHKPMCISLSNDTITRVMVDMLQSLVFWGINKIIIINGHDGNIPGIEISARNVKLEFPDIHIAIMDSWWETAGKLLPPNTFEVDNGLGHGGEGETSISLAIVPHLVDMSQAKGMVPKMDPHIKLIWNFQELTEYGATGAPKKATEEKGILMKQTIVKYLVNFIKRMDTQGWHIETR